MDISLPCNVQHQFHVEIDKKGHFKNLPAEWTDKINYSVISASMEGEDILNETEYDSSLVQSQI